MQDAGEGGLGGVTVQLMNAAGTSVLATTTTSSSGAYQFSNLTAGTYQVLFGTKSGYVLTSANQGTDDFKDSDANTSTRLSGPIYLSSGENEVSIDAGMVVPMASKRSNSSPRQGCSRSPTIARRRRRLERPSRI